MINFHLKAAILFLLLSVAACTSVKSPSTQGETSLRVARLPSLINVSSRDQIATVSEIIHQQSEIMRRNTRLTSRQMLEATPLLFDSPYSALYWSSGSDRSMAMGLPQPNCPALAVGSSASAALGGCLDQLESRKLLGQTDESAGTCGCAIIARSNLLLAPADAFRYSRNMPARYFVNGSLSPAPIFLREIASDPDFSRLLVVNNDPRNAVTIGINGSTEAVLQSWAKGRPSAPILLQAPPPPASSEPTGWRGQSTVSGMYHGRYSEVIRLNDQDGNELLIILGQPG